jgi:hypothetical protein
MNFQGLINDHFKISHYVTCAQQESMRIHSTPTLDYDNDDDDSNDGAGEEIFCLI